METHGCNHSIQQTEAGASQFEVSLGYIAKPCFKEGKKKKSEGHNLLQLKGWSVSERRREVSLGYSRALVWELGNLTTLSAFAGSAAVVLDCTSGHSPKTQMIILASLFQTGSTSGQHQ
jgi:hypothetical protein